MKLLLLLLGRWVFFLLCWTAVLLAFAFMSVAIALVRWLPYGTRHRHITAPELVE
jgi:hypothetical protein